MTPGWIDSIPHAWIWIVLAGLCLGSFLNVVIHRLPRGESIVRPRSSCPRCGRGIAPWENVPLVSYIALRGRCRGCRSPISLRYPINEAVAGACLLAAVASSSGPGEAGAKAAFLLAMLAVAWIDLDHRIIPDEISLSGIALGILAAPWLGMAWWEGLLGAAVGAGALLGVASLYRAARGTDGMGMGDVKLAGMMGAFLGWKGVAMALVLGSFAGALLGLALVAAGRAQGKSALPYGTFLAPSAGLVLLAGPKIWAWYLQVLGWGQPGTG